LKLLGYPISSVATLHEETAQAASKELNISKYYTNHLELLEKEKPDAVFISVAPDQQFQVTKDALNAGVHVFVEKPLGMNLSEAQEIAELSESSGKHVMVGYMKKFAPGYVKVKELISAKSFGKQLSITQQFTSRNFAKTSTEYLMFAAIHYVDLLRDYYGEVVSISGDELNFEGSIMLSYSVKFESGAIGSLQYGGSPAWEKGSHEMCITGQNGYVKVSGIDKVISYTKNLEIKDPRWQTIAENEQTFGTMLTTGASSTQLLYLNGFVGELKHFVESIEAGKAPINSAAENVKTMEVVEFMVKALGE